MDNDEFIRDIEKFLEYHTGDLIYDYIYNDSLDILRDFADEEYTAGKSSNHYNKRPSDYELLMSCLDADTIAYAFVQDIISMIHEKHTEDDERVDALYDYINFDKIFTDDVIDEICHLLDE